MKEAVGFEIPGLPADLGPLGESATTAVQDVTDSATGVVDGPTAVTDAITGLPLDGILPK